MPVAIVPSIPAFSARIPRYQAKTDMIKVVLPNFPATTADLWIAWPKTYCGWFGKPA